MVQVGEEVTAGCCSRGSAMCYAQPTIQALDHTALDTPRLAGFAHQRSSPVCYDGMDPCLYAVELAVDDWLKHQSTSHKREGPALKHQAPTQHAGV